MVLITFCRFANNSAKTSDEYRKVLSELRKSKIKQSVDFAEWISRSEWVLTDFENNLWIDCENEKLGTLISTNELFIQFLESTKSVG